HDGRLRRWRTVGRSRHQPRGDAGCQPARRAQETQGKQGEFTMRKSMKTVAAALLAACSFHGYAAAETVLRLDEVAVGELDPAKASDYADSILMYNVYDTLVMPKAGQPGHDPLLAESWETDGKTYTFKLRTDAKFQSG